MPADDRPSRLKKITQNFFFHIHSPVAHPESLKPTTTFGLGVILGCLFLILLVTGLLLMLYYTPSVERAYASVKDIVFVIKGGRYIRNLHRWAGHGMVIAALLHLLRVFYTGSYLKRRALNWNIGIAMLIITLLLSFSGYLLPWDQLAFWAVTIGSNIAASMRELTDVLGLTAVFDPGGLVKRLLIGDETVGQPALSRFYMLHVILLPLTLLVLMGWHFWRIRKDGGLARPAGTEVRGGYLGAGPPTHSIKAEKEAPIKTKDLRVTTWPTVLWAELALLAACCAVLMALAFFFDAPLREQANPMLPENPAKSPWYFLGIQELVSYSAFTGGVLIPLLFMVFLVSLPLKDREDRYAGIWFSGAKGRRLSIYSGLYAFSLTSFLLFINIHFGWVSDWIEGVPRAVIIFFNPGALIVTGYVLWSAVIRYRTGSDRHAAIALFTCAVVGFVLLTALGTWFRGPDWEFYWLKSWWPAH